jgi:hypothetical protein
MPAPFTELDSEALASDKDWGWSHIIELLEMDKDRIASQKRVGRKS